MEEDHEGEGWELNQYWMVCFQNLQLVCLLDLWLVKQ